MLTNSRVRRFRVRLRAWGKGNIRAYPWRYQLDPYAVFVAEFMLHRTQARQVEPVYERFIAEYPTLADYAHERRGDIERMLRPLGLRWRVEAMLNALDELWHEYSAVPVDFTLLSGIYGVGQYIAGATVCFTQNLPRPLIDSNTVRVVGRVFGLELQGEARRQRLMIESVGMVCDPKHPRDFYYALIDLSHKICRPSAPLCAECPLLAVPCVFGEIRIGAREGGATNAYAPGSRKRAVSNT